MTVASSVPEPAAKGAILSSRGPQLAAALGIAALVTCGLLTSGFFTIDNIKAILSSMAVTGIVAVGMTTIMVGGGLASLSLGTSAAVCAMVFAYGLDSSLIVASLATLAFGVLVVGVQGFVIGRWAANPIVLTIAAGALQTGTATALADGATVRITSGDARFLTRSVAGFPVSVVVALTFAGTVEFILRRTSVGQQARLTGTNREAARAAGLSPGRTQTAMFAIAGASAAVAGALLAAGNNQGSLLLQGTLTFDAIAAALVGGSRIAGGHGSALTTMAGAFVIAAASDLLLLNSFSTSAQVLLKGVLVIVVVVAVHMRTSRR